MKYLNVCCNIQVNLRHMGGKRHERYLTRKQFDHFSILENTRLSFPTKAHGSQASLQLQEGVTYLSHRKQLIIPMVFLPIVHQPEHLTHQGMTVSCNVNSSSQT